jgi:hypothetical protein
MIRNLLALLLYPLRRLLCAVFRAPLIVDDADLRYDLRGLRAPRLTGCALRALVWLLECPLTRWMLVPKVQYRWSCRQQLKTVSLARRGRGS